MESEKNPAAVALGRQGGLARAKLLTAKQRKASATKASKAAAEARKRKAYNKRMEGLARELKSGTTKLVKRVRLPWLG
jgi:hypothetical protein